MTGCADADTVKDSTPQGVVFEAWQSNIGGMNVIQPLHCSTSCNVENEQTVQIGPSVQLSIASAGNRAMGLPLVSSKTS
jgi:hypothetical protein